MPSVEGVDEGDAELDAAVAEVKTISVVSTDKDTVVSVVVKVTVPPSLVFHVIGT